MLLINWMNFSQQLNLYLDMNTGNIHRYGALEPYTNEKFVLFVIQVHGVHIHAWGTCYCYRLDQTEFVFQR